MARVSKKVSAQRRQEEQARSRIWKAAIYARLSNFESGDADEETLEVQIAYIRAFLERQPDLKLVDVFADKGFTGTNFSRPEFERLLRALQSKTVDCILVKDFSRLGRNFVETGQYLEQVFPLLGVRFISVNDNYDSKNQQSREGMLVPIKGMMNELYSKDLSRKVKSSFRAREKNGEIYTLPPFGYKRDAQNRGRLVLDEKVSDAVLQMFLWRKSGCKNAEIAERLTAQRTPIVFARRCELGYLKNTQRVARTEWNSEDVQKILENPVYTGTMVYNRIAYDSHYRRLTRDNPREEWRVLPDNHPAIITWELFDEVQKKVEEERQKRTENQEKNRALQEAYPNPFQGILYCHHCGNKISARWLKSGRKYYSCSNRRCSQKVSVNEEQLWNALNETVQRKLSEQKRMAQAQINGNAMVETAARLAALEQRLRSLIDEQTRLQEKKKRAYESYAVGVLKLKEYICLRDEVNMRLVKIAEQQMEIDREQQQLRECYTPKVQKPEIPEDLILTAENLRQYAARVEVDKNNSVSVELMYK